MRSCGSTVAAVLVAFVLAACHPPQPAPYASRTAIPLGHVTVQVGSLEHSEAPFAGAAPEDRYYTVRVRVSGLQSVEARSDRRDYVRNFLEHQASLRDGDGDMYRPVVVAAESWFDDEYWLVLFGVPEVSRDFTLLLRNPDPAAGQPTLASVHLGMPGGTT